MLDDFFTRALIAGIGVALVAGPLGCFVLWRRIAYFSETISHAALMGVALAFLVEVDVLAGIAAAVGLAAAVLLLAGRDSRIATDTVLGILAPAALALGIVLASLMPWVQIDLLGYLFGDILSVSRTDIAIIYGGGAVILVVLALLWRPLIAATFSPELAAAEGLRPDAARAVYTLLLAAAVAVAIKVVGVLLITALLVIPAAAARRFARGPETMAALAAAAGVLAVVGGLYGSLQFDTPSGPSIVVAAAIIFAAASLVPRAPR